jgi:hypothetical protein
MIHVEFIPTWTGLLLTGSERQRQSLDRPPRLNETEAVTETLLKPTLRILKKGRQGFGIGI